MYDIYEIIIRTMKFNGVLSKNILDKWIFNKIQLQLTTKLDDTQRIRRISRATKCCVHPVLRSAKRAPSNVRRPNNRKWRQRYCLVGERLRALALLNAALIYYKYVLEFSASSLRWPTITCTSNRIVHDYNCSPRHVWRIAAITEDNDLVQETTNY